MIHSFWYGVFWPYFQFVVFLAAVIYLARKPINNFLESKRDEFRTKLSEAKEALTTAERKIAQYEAQIAALTQDVENIRLQYLENAELEQKRILDEANLSAEMILSDAKRIALELISQTRNELQDEMFKRVVEQFEKQLTQERMAKLDTHLQQEVVRSIPQALKSSRLSN